MDLLVSWVSNVVFSHLIHRFQLCFRTTRLPLVPPSLCSICCFKLKFSFLPISKGKMTGLLYLGGMTVSALK